MRTSSKRGIINAANIVKLRPYSCSGKNSSAPVGEVKQFVRFGKRHYYEKTENGCVELSRAKYNERSNFNAENIDGRAERGIGETADTYGSAERNAIGYPDGDRNSGRTEILSRHTIGERLRNDTAGSLSSVVRDNNSVSDSIDDTDIQYSIRTSPAPKKTKIGYKVFRVDKNHPGQLYPTKIANPGKFGTPVGVWLDADTGEIARNADGSIKTNTKGRIAVKANSDNSGTLAWRPGWHLGQMPEANQMNVENPADPRSKDRRRHTRSFLLYRGLTSEGTPHRRCCYPPTPADRRSCFSLRKKL